MIRRDFLVTFVVCNFLGRYGLYPVWEKNNFSFSPFWGKSLSVNELLCTLAVNIRTSPMGRELSWFSPIRPEYIAEFQVV